MKYYVGFACLLAAIAAAGSARAAAIDTLTLTPSGTETVFDLTGTYTANTPTTPFSSPNTPYILAFTVPTTPSVLDFSDLNGTFGIGTTATLNSVSFPGSQAIVFDAFHGGGFLLCLGMICNLDPTMPPFPAANYWNIIGDQVFTGTVFHPTFVSGSLSINSGQSIYSIAAPIPEPASAPLAAFGMAAVVLYLRRRCPHRRIHVILANGSV